jgi:predicted regulator of Ras-like GTPase activity (Roadblock/LC7/MglB family)
MAQEEIRQTINRAIQKARSGDKTAARDMLLEVAERAPSREDVWFWLAGLSEDPEDAKVYLETVLALNPDHQKAKEGLKIINKVLTKGSAPASQDDAPASQDDTPAPKPKSPAETKTPPPQAETPTPPPSTPHPMPTEQTTCPSCGQPMPADSPFCSACGHIAGKPAAEDVEELAPIPAEAPVESEAFNVSDEISPSFSLSIKQAEAIDACLERMAYESEASCIILADVTGQLISERGRVEGINTQVLSALAAGELSATQEMARLVGERARFNLMLHEGEERSVYLSPVGKKMLLIVVFDGKTPIGLVRIILKNAVEELGPILERPVQQQGDEDFSETLNGDFAQQLEDEMDASLDFLIE